MAFFIFLIAVATVVVLTIALRRQAIRSAWDTAAARLGLRFEGGTFFQHLSIFGQRKGFRIDVRTFPRRAGAKVETWTGYRVSFPEPTLAHLGRTRLQSLYLRVSKQFKEFEIDESSLFGAVPHLETATDPILARTANLLEFAEQIRTLALDGEPVEEPPPPAPAHAPPPLPAARKEDECPPPGSPAEAAPVPEPDVPPAAIPEPEPEPEVVVPEPEPRPVNDPPADPAPVLELIEDEDPVLSLQKAARDLFDTGRNRYETGRRFDSEYRGLSLSGHGLLRRAAPFSNDRVFGRGPGTLAEVEIHRTADPAIAGLTTIFVSIALPGEVDARALREMTGARVEVRGTLTRCDAFSGTIFLSDGLIEPVSN